MVIEKVNWRNISGSPASKFIGYECIYCYNNILTKIIVIDIKSGNEK